MEKLPEKVLLLIRVSSQKQDFEYQKEELEKYVLNEGIYNESQIHIIEDIESGLLNEEDREGLKKLDEAINSTEFTVKCVYVTDFSRLSRNGIILLQWVNKFEKKGINFKSKNQFFTLLDNYGNVTPMKQMLYYMAGSVEEDSNRRSAFIKDGIRNKSENGFCQKNNLFFGYKHDEKNKDIKELRNKIVIDEEEAKLVRTIFNLYETGRYGSGMIVRELNGKGMAFNLTSDYITKILAYELYTGEPRDCTWKKKDKKTGAYKTSTYKRQLPQIITREQFNKCREIALKQNCNPTKSKQIYFGNHLIKCTCDKNFTVSNHGNDRRAYYTCIHCGSGVKISYKILDSVLWFYAKGFEAETILNTKEEDIQKYKDLIVERQYQIEKVNLSFENFKIKTFKDWKKQFSHWTTIDLEREFNNDKNSKLQEDKKKFENCIRQFRRDIENYTAFIENLEGNLKLKKEKFFEDAVKDFENMNLSYPLNEICRPNPDRIDFALSMIQIDNIKSELDMYDDFRKRNIINKYVKEVRIKPFTDVNTPTLQIDIYCNLSDKVQSIYYSYRQMNEDKRLFTFINGTKYYKVWEDIYLEKFVNKEVKPVNKRSELKLQKKNALIECVNKVPSATAVQYKDMLHEIGVEIPLPSIYSYLREIKKS